MDCLKRIILICVYDIDNNCTEVYNYDNRGNILTVSKSGTLFLQYVYDEASQVKAEYNYAEHTAMTYVYDANGNIVSKTPYTNVTSSDLSTATQGTAIIYGYGDSNWSDKLTSYNGQTISYDASGNPTSYRGETVTWNGRLMTSYTKDGCLYEYEYNSDGMRTIRRMYKNGELASTIRYIWDGDVLLGTRMESVDSDETFLARYLYDDSGELYGMEYKGLENAGSGMFAFIKNLQGDIVSITPLDSESNVEVNMEYDAWGKPIIQQASSMTEGLLMAIMMMVTNVGYRGYFYDLETELYYLRSRYYDPEIGRFINADDVEMMIPQKPSNITVFTNNYYNLNIYSYCQNNPVVSSDYSGRKSKSNPPNLTTKAFVLILFTLAIWDDKIIEIKNGGYNEKDRVKGQISVNFIAGYGQDTFYNIVDALLKMYGNEIYDIITEVALGKFKNQYSYPYSEKDGLKVIPYREFLFSKKCVSNEIQKHFEGYMWSIGKKGYHCPFMFKAYTFFSKEKIRESCMVADILEMGPIYELAESMGFNYYDGILSTYKYTRKDPYYYPKERKRKRVANNEWRYYAF